MKVKKLIVTSLVVTGMLLTVGCVGKFHKGEFQNKIFEKFDKDSNGYLSKKEHLNIALHRFKRVDDNEDGKITKEELQECRFARFSPDFVENYFKNNDLDSNGVVSKAEVIEQTKSKFIKADKNSDGVISKVEFQKIKSPFKR